MANFEALIRGALAAKGAGSPEERAVVYQSSRNALKRLVEANRSITVESAMSEQKQLEESILRIEAEFQNLFVPRDDQAEAIQIEDPLVSPIEEASQEASLAEAITPKEEIESAPTPRPPSDDPFLEIQQVLGVAPQTTQETIAEDKTEEIEPVPEALPPELSEPLPTVEEIIQPEPVLEDYSSQSEIYVEEPATIPSGFAKRRKTQKNFFWFILFLVIIGLLAWIGYRLFMGFIDGSLLGQNTAAGQSSSQLDAQSSYFSIVEPGDLTALEVSDRGRVEIVNEQGLEMIRILSVRNPAERTESAKPILLRLKPGVIEQIRGKRVTAEIFARSGKSGPAQFAIECQFGAQIGCGRKRFRIGVQPEASIFAFTMENNRDINSDAYIAISTDITDNASITGEGDILDIVYVRLRTAKGK